MSGLIQQRWIDDLQGVVKSISAIKEAWFFGSRAKGIGSNKSDLDIAVRIEPSDGKILAEWMFNAESGKKKLQDTVGDTPVIDLQLSHPETSEVVWTAVDDHGICFFRRKRE